MYAVINHVHLDIPVAQILDSLAAGGLPLLASLPGYRGFYCVEEAPDRAALIILWDSAHAAANGAQVLGPGWFAEIIAPHLASEQRRSVGEVVLQHQP